jgi:hypothetical protein
MAQKAQIPESNDVAINAATDVIPCLFIAGGLRPANHLQVEYGSAPHFVGMREPSALHSRDLSGWPQYGTNPNFRIEISQGVDQCQIANSVRRDKPA